MCSVPWVSESERADYYQELYNDQLAICDRLDGHLQRYIEEVRKLERERDDILADVQLEASERLEAAIKAEAIKEFWSRLQGVAYQSEREWSHGEHPMLIELDDAKEIYEEMVGDAE